MATSSSKSKTDTEAATDPAAGGDVAATGDDRADALTGTPDAQAGADAQAAAEAGDVALPDAGPAPIDHRALALAKHLQAQDPDVVRAAVDYIEAAENRRAAGTPTGQVPDGRAQADRTTIR